MAWSWVASSSAGGSAGTSLTGISRPAGIASGDWIVASFLVNAPTAQTLAFSNGTWTKIRSDRPYGDLQLYVSRYAGEGSTFNLTWDGTSCNRSAALSAYRGGGAAAAGDPFNPTGTAHLTPGSATVSFDGFTPNVADELVIYAAGHGYGFAGQVTVPTGTTPAFTERIDMPWLAQGGGIQTTAQAIGNRTATIGIATDNGGQLFGFTLGVAVQSQAPRSLHRYRLARV